MSIQEIQRNIMNSLHKRRLEDPQHRCLPMHVSLGVTEDIDDEVLHKAVFGLISNKDVILLDGRLNGNAWVPFPLIDATIILPR